jgi:hypothetical protein
VKSWSDTGRWTMSLVIDGSEEIGHRLLHGSPEFLHPWITSRGWKIETAGASHIGEATSWLWLPRCW